VCACKLQNRAKKVPLKRQQEAKKKQQKKKTQQAPNTQMQTLKEHRVVHTLADLFKH